jgi:hypothetical protein
MSVGSYFVSARTHKKIIIIIYKIEHIFPIKSRIRTPIVYGSPQEPQVSLFFLCRVSIDLYI